MACGQPAAHHVRLVFATHSPRQVLSKCPPFATAMARNLTHKHKLFDHYLRSARQACGLMNSKSRNLLSWPLLRLGLDFCRFLGCSPLLRRDFGLKSCQLSQLNQFSQRSQLSPLSQWSQMSPLSRWDQLSQWCQVGHLSQLSQLNPVGQGGQGSQVRQ